MMVGEKTMYLIVGGLVVKLCISLCVEVGGEIVHFYSLWVGGKVVLFSGEPNAQFYP